MIDRFADLPCGRQRIVVHCAQRSIQRRTVELSFRPIGIRRLVHHPRGEGLVEPDVIPPVGRHEVAEPHVSYLVRVNRGVGAPLRHGRVLVHQQQVFVIDNRANIFHCAAEALGNGDQVELLIGIWCAEILFEDRQQAIGVFQRVFGTLRLSFRHDTAQPDAAIPDGIWRDRAVVDDVVRADRECKQVSRHRPRCLERVTHEAVRQGFGACLGRGRDGSVAGLRHQCKVEGDLEARLIEAREYLPCRDRLELRRGIGVAVAQHLKQRVG